MSFIHTSPCSEYLKKTETLFFSKLDVYFLYIQSTFRPQCFHSTGVIWGCNFSKSTSDIVKKMLLFYCSNWIYLPTVCSRGVQATDSVIYVRFSCLFCPSVYNVWSSIKGWVATTGIILDQAHKKKPSIMSYWTLVLFFWLAKNNVQIVWITYHLLNVILAEITFQKI